MDVIHKVYCSATTFKDPLFLFEHNMYHEDPLEYSLIYNYVFYPMDLIVRFTAMNGMNNIFRNSYDEILGEVAFMMEDINWNVSLCIKVDNMHINPHN